MYAYMSRLLDDLIEAIHVEVAQIDSGMIESEEAKF